MNLSEFKAWFGGFTENMSAPPNKKQWARIQERVGEISSEPTPWPFFSQRYIEPHSPYWTFLGGGVYQTRSQMMASIEAPCDTTVGSTPTYGTTPSEVFTLAGRAEANMIESGDTA